MMHFEFCTSHVHAFFMHMYPFIPISSCDCVLSHSLSLSLSPPRIDYTMASKPKSTPSRNPLQGSNSSSFSNPIPPLHVQFHDGKAQQDFLKNFQKHSIHPERHVVLSDFSDTPPPDVIRTRDWDSLMEEPLRCPIVFVQEFYTNIHGIDTFVPCFATTFQGTRIAVTPNLISEVLHVPMISHPDYPGYERLQTISTDELLSHFYETPSIWGGK